MAVEYVVAGRRASPIRQTKEVWTHEIEHYFEDGDDDSEGGVWDEGRCFIYEIEPDPGEYLDFVTQRAGFKPVSIISIRPAGFEFSECAASVIAAAVDGVYFCDAVSDQGPWETLDKADRPTTFGDLEQRLAAAFQKGPNEFFQAVAARDEAAAAAWARKNPEEAAAAAALNAQENDWSDV